MELLVIGMCTLFQIKVSIGTAVSPYSQLKEHWVSNLAYCQKATYCYMWQQCIYGHVTVSKMIPLYNLSGCIYFDVVRETPKKRMLRFNWNINLVAVKRQNRCCLKCKAVYCGIDALCLFPRGQWPDNRSNSDWIVFVTGVMTLDRLLQCSVWIPPFCTIDAERFATGIHCSADRLASDWWATPCARLLTTLPNSVCEITTRCWISALHARHFHGLVSSWAPILVEK